MGFRLTNSPIEIARNPSSRTREKVEEARSGASTHILHPTFVWIPLEM